MLRLVPGDLPPVPQPVELPAPGPVITPVVEATPAHSWTGRAFAVILMAATLAGLGWAGVQGYYLLTDARPVPLHMSRYCANVAQLRLAHQRTMDELARADAEVSRLDGEPAAIDVAVDLMASAQLHSYRLVHLGEAMYASIGDVDLGVTDAPRGHLAFRQETKALVLPDVIVPPDAAIPNTVPSPVRVTAPTHIPTRPSPVRLDTRAEVLRLAALVGDHLGHEETRAPGMHLAAPLTVEIGHSDHTSRIGLMRIGPSHWHFEIPHAALSMILTLRSSWRAAQPRAKAASSLVFGWRSLRSTSWR